MSVKVIVSMDKRNNAVYHREGCCYAERIQYRNRMTIARGDARQLGYRACKCCCGLGGDLRIKSKGGAVKKWQKTLHVTLTYDKQYDQLYIRTANGFWQIRPINGGELYLLYHLNHYEAQASTTDLMKRGFHRQSDVAQTASLHSLIEYAHRHDQAKEIMKGDYHRLPRDTRRQKKYYRQAQKREQRRSIRRVDELFAMLDQERMAI